MTLLGCCLCAVAAPWATAQLPLAEQRVVLRGELGVNSAGVDYPTYLWDGGLAYVSTQEDARLRKRIRPRGRRRRPLEQLWLARADTAGLLRDPEPFMRDRRTRVNVGPFTYDEAAQLAYVTRNAGPPRSRSRVAKRLQVYERERLGGGAWGEPRALEFADATGDDAHPALSADGALMVFASDRDGGFGGLDLWGVRRGNGMWGAPFNLGSGVNGGGNEAFPFLHPDGTLYFATTVAGADGAADHLDLAYARERDGARGDDAGGEGAWGERVFLGAPFNSPADDFALLVAEDNRGGYFASSRAGGLGEDDVYRFEIVETAVDLRAPPARLTLAIVDEDSGAPLPGASVVYLDADATSLSSALAREVVTVEGTPLRVVGGERYMTDVNGEGVIDVRAGTFLLEVAREGYERAVVRVEVDAGQSHASVGLSPKRACAHVSVSVLEEGSARPVPGARLLAEAQAADDAVARARTDDGAAATLCLPCGDVYVLTAVSGRRQSAPVTFRTDDGACGERSTQTTLTLYVADRSAAATYSGGVVAPVAAGTPLAAGTQFQMPDVYYALNDYRLNAAARENLDELGRLMRQFPEMRIELGSHTDANGAADLNRDLSQRRADEARRYLVASAGVAPARVVAVGYGESRLRNGCRDGVRCSAARHRENRRTEVTILGEGVPGGKVAAATPSTRRPSASPALTRPLAPREAHTQTVYFVIAGTYATRQAAAPNAAELRALGYDGIEVARVPGVEGFSVVGARFPDRAEAKEFARALREAHARAAYVHGVARR